MNSACYEARNVVLEAFYENDNIEQPKNPLHGVTLEQIVTRLVEQYGWEKIALRIKINCFTTNPSIKSSLFFFRKTPWAREKVERLYLSTLKKNSARKKKEPRRRVIDEKH